MQGSYTARPCGLSGKILILDPDPNEIGAVSARLREAGYETVIASKGRAALEKVAEVQPEVVVLSAELADVDALEVKSALGSDPASRHIPVTPTEDADGGPPGPEAIADATTQ